MKTKLTVILLLLWISCLEAQPWSWSTNNLSYAREGLSAAVLNDNIYYSGGRIYNWGAFSNITDIYNVTTNVWSTIELESTPRWFTSAVSCNGKVFIAGGNNYPDNDSYSDVDIYDSTTNAWTVESLSVPRNLMGTVAHMNKVFFAGGLHSGGGVFYDVVDIYNTETETWDTIYLTVPKCAIGATAAGGKVFFAGGGTDYGVMTDVVEIYDIETSSWLDDIYLSEARSFIAAVAYGNMVYFAGGTAGGEGSDVVDVYNVEDAQWEPPQTLSFPRVVRALKVKDALVFSGECEYISNGQYVNANGMIDIYYPDDDVWDSLVPDLSPARIWYACAAYENKAYYAGGLTYGSEIMDTINILKYDYEIGFQETKFSGLEIQVFPNPFSSTIQIDFSLQRSSEVKLSIYDNYGKQVGIVVNEYLQQGNQQVMFNSEKLEPGIYLCVLKTNEGMQTKKIIKL